jgi:hypothetical protein
MWQTSALRGLPRVSKGISVQVRHGAVTSALLGRTRDPRQHTFSFIGVGFSMGRRRGYGLFLNAHY